MATQIWQGSAASATQVNTITPAAVAIGNQFSVTINGKSVTFTATAATVANVTAGLVALCAAGGAPLEFADIAWADATSAVTATAKVAGKPFTQTSSASGGTATLTTAATVAATGPNDWSNAGNWSTGAVPTSGDDVFVQNSSVSILYGLAQTAVTLASLNIDQSFTGTIGLPKTAGAGGAGYVEYRPTYLAVGATTLNLGRGDVGAGSGRVKIDSGSVQTTINVMNTGSSADQAIGLKSFLWIGTHAANVVNVNKGSFGAAVFAGEIATIATLNEAYLTNVSGDSDVKLGAGCTLTTIHKIAGKLEINSDVTTLTQNDGETVLAAGAPGTINLHGGTLRYRSAGTATTVNQYGGTLDFSQDQRPRTLSNLTMYKGATLLDPEKSVTFTSGIAIEGQLSDVTLSLGFAITLARS